MLNIQNTKLTTTNEAKTELNWNDILGSEHKKQMEDASKKFDASRNKKIFIKPAWRSFRMPTQEQGWFSRPKPIVIPPEFQSGPLAEYYKMMKR